MDPTHQSREAERLAALRRYEILDTGPEPVFDDLVALASRLCACPMSTVTLIDERRQWFKASVGLSVAETPREIAFCAWTIAEAEPLIVLDAGTDSRFKDNPLVTGDPGIRFYAGFPLVTREGFAVGALSVMDTVPRQLDGTQMSAMQALASQVTALLEVRGSLRQIKDGEAEMVLAQRRLEQQLEERTRLLELERARLEHAELRFRSLWETTPDAVLILDEHSIVEYANPSAERLFGLPRTAIEGNAVSLLQPERLRQSHLQGMAAYLRSGVRRLDWRAVETWGLHVDGREIPIEISFSELRLQGKRLFVGFIRDISERKRANEALQEERERAQSTLRCIGDGVITTDQAGRVVALNPMAERITGWTDQDARGVPCALVLKLVHEGSGEPLHLPLDLAEGEAAEALKLPAAAGLISRSGALKSVEGSAARLSSPDGNVSGWVIAIRDVSHARALAAQVAFQAAHDSLTGLVNRAEFDRRLRDAIEASAVRRRPASLLYLDLDQFKVVNDTCGHIAGDELLRQLAGILLLHIRVSDTLARLGGDEFGVLLENCPEDRAVLIAQKLCDAVSEFAFVWGGQMFSTAVSIGHVHFEEGTLQAGEILSKADEACYVAKDLGRNRVHTYRAGEEAQARRHGQMQWVNLIHQAFEEDRFVLFAQPIFATSDVGGVPTHHEVLLRLKDSQGELVAPMAFIPAAERYGLMPRLDRWVIHHLLSVLTRAFDHPSQCDLAFAINLSGSSLGDPLLAGFILAELQASGLPGRCVGFEITETAAIANLSNAIKLIEELKSAGCWFSLDDFGSGLSSFTYLKHLPVDFLKIDGSFVTGIATDPVDRAMVASINEIGHVMGLRTIAEFVENEQILRELQVIGVDYGQGFGLGRPVPLGECLRPGIGGSLAPPASG